MKSAEDFILELRDEFSKPVGVVAAALTRAGRLLGEGVESGIVSEGDPQDVSDVEQFAP